MGGRRADPRSISAQRISAPTSLTMRLWTVHPKYLDVRGLGALWREALLARAVLRGQTRGYKRHPQLQSLGAVHSPDAHPIFRVLPGALASWERPAEERDVRVPGAAARWCKDLLRRPPAG